ncbi:hypothetical protein C8A01DRAFT_14127 [Parachaetomium inaequale]|uniref:Uncharacterized protein n=1 Tax=Parachaetomium inaequale TaxID=2588326 RepID=A0AAN6PN50_9PEZI|nr:hypothetical protein C8A01DRAFT_14127 [Parachaetomium inaequale]
MAQHNSGASAAGTARPPAARLTKRAALSAPSAFQLFLEQRRRALRNSTSPESNPKIAFLEKPLTPSLSQPPLNHRALSSLHRKAKRSVLHHHSSKPPALAKLARLYRRHRNPERALRSFLLRRQLWRRTRRPFNMDFIDHLRHIQADEPSSDEDSGTLLTAVTVPAPRRPSPASKPAPVAASDLTAKTKTTGAKRKRDAPAEALTENANAETSRAAMMAKSQGTPPAPVANGTKSPKKRTLDAEKADVDVDARATKKAKTAKPAPTKAEAEAGSSKAAATATATTKTTAGPGPQKPVGQMEYFERRAHDMLTDPLGFDDYVYDSNKQTPRHVARSFAKYRRRQSQSPPPLVMSGALGPAPAANPANPKPKGSGSLAREAQKRAHQQKVEGRVQGLKGKGKAVEESSSAHEKGKAVVARQQAMANGGVGKRKEKRWLTNARQTGGKGGQHHQGGLVKYKKSV